MPPQPAPSSFYDAVVEAEAKADARRKLGHAARIAIITTLCCCSVVELTIRLWWWL